MKKITHRKLKALETSEKIYDAAIVLINEKGYENVSIEDITKAAGTSIGSFYTHFDSKKKLLYHTIKKYDKFSEDAYSTVENMSDFKMQLTMYVELSYTNYSILGKEILKALYQNNLLDKVPLVSASNRQIYTAISCLVEQGKARGELDASKPTKYYVDILITMIMGLDYRWCTSVEGFDFAKIAKSTMEALLDGLASK